MAMASNTFREDLPVPGWLQLPVSAVVPPPVESSVQHLPFDDLSWENFERLCLRLAQVQSNVGECRLYGRQGDSQEGIDFYTQSGTNDNFVVYQCKRVKGFGASKIAAAFKTFQAGAFLDATVRFVLCTSDSLRGSDRDDEWRKQKANLLERGVEVERWDADGLDVLLKDHPQIVYDFFGPSWFRRYFQRDPQEYSSRLTPEKVIEFRCKLHDFYRIVFDQADPGIILGAGHEAARKSVTSRYVVPDIEEELAVARRVNERADVRRIATLVPDAFTMHHHNVGEAPINEELNQRTVIRTKLDQWLTRSDTSIILGEAGLGKSSLLRFLILDLLSAEPTLPIVTQKWGKHLPLWIPFPFWVAHSAGVEKPSMSLSAILRNWFHRYDRADLWPLVAQALEDSRILLLVDGLDEWQDDTAARITLDQLVVFVRDRQVPAVLVSRPQGFKQLRSAVSDWQVAKLATFSVAQQKDFASIWFSEDCIRELKIEDSAVAARAKTVEFMANLARVPDFAELAGVPLLLALLIRLTIERLDLPRNRFDAYDDIVDLLLDYHPRARRAASQVVGGSDLAKRWALSGNDLKDAYAALAWQLHSNSDEGVAHDVAARKWIETHLGGPLGIGLAPSESRVVARILVEAGETEYGLLVSKGAHEVGFFHRICQEALAARYLLSLSDEEQQSFLLSSAISAHWREVVLSFLHHESKQKVRKHLATLRAVQDGDILARQSLEQLLAQIAFGEVRIFAEDHESLIENAFRTIEHDGSMVHRVSLLKTALGAFRAQTYVSREAVRTRSRHWFPAVNLRRSQLLLEMKNWPRSEELLAVLLKNLCDEDAANGRAAAESLAALWRGHIEVGDQLCRIARSSSDPNARACALESLQSGWPGNPAISDLISLNRQCGAAIPMLVAISIAVERGLQTERDRDILLDYATRKGRLGGEYIWREKTVLTVLEGWPGDAFVRLACLAGIRAPRYGEETIAHEIAFPLLLFGYPGDDEVAAAILQALSDRDYLFELTPLPDRENLPRRAAQWANHQILEAGVESWLKENGTTFGYSSIDLCFFAKTEGTKALMVQKLRNRKTFCGFALHVLLRVWGMEDQMVAAAIHEYVSGHPSGHAEAQEEVLCVAKDLEVARQAAIVSLSSADLIESKQALTALRAIDGNLAADDVVQCCIGRWSGDLQMWRTWFLPNLVAYGQDHPVVKDLTIGYIDADYCSDFCIALGCGRDPLVRKALLRRAAPLPTALREELASSLESVSADDVLVDEILMAHKAEASLGVAFIASISLGRRMRHRSDNEEVIQALLEDASVEGDSSIRQVGIAGLLAAHSLTRVEKVEVREDELERERFGWMELARSNAYQRLITEEWDYIEGQLGVDRFARMFRAKSFADMIHAFESLKSGSGLARWALRELSDKHAKFPRMGWDLKLIAAAYPRSEQLKQVCLDKIGRFAGEKGSDAEMAMAAAMLLGDSFQGDEKTLKQLVGDGDDSLSDAVVVALCRGWPECNPLKQWLQQAVSSQQNVHWLTYWHTFASHGYGDEVEGKFSEVQSLKRSNALIALRESEEAFISRCRRDKGFADALCALAVKEPVDSISITAWGLLTTSGTITPELRKWLVAKAVEFSQAESSPGFGRDLFGGLEVNIRDVVLSQLA